MGFLFVCFDEVIKIVLYVFGDFKLIKINKMIVMLILCIGVIYVLYYEFRFILSRLYLNNKILMMINI